MAIVLLVLIVVFVVGFVRDTIVILRRKQISSGRVQLVLEVESNISGNIEAFVMHDGKRIDGHTHSTEGWLISDWFQGDEFNHRQTISKALGGRPFDLTYVTFKGDRYYMVG